MTLSLFLRPVDVWLFGDGRPFDVGIGNRAESIFPPYPTVVQGAFRTYRLLIHQTDLSDQKAIQALVGPPDGFGALRLRGPFLAQKEKEGIVRYFPQPADAIVDGETLIPPRVAAPPDTLKSGAPLPLLFQWEGEAEKHAHNLWVREDALLEYLKGKATNGIPEQRLFSREERLGIGMDDRRVTVESMLYEAEFIRPAPGVGLLVEMDGFPKEEWERGGILHLGGDKRMAVFEAVEAPHRPALPKQATRFKLYFATPACFENGWCPADWGKFFAHPVKLVAAALQRYETRGGFNRAFRNTNANAHRPSRRFIPAGSVYYFEGSPELRPGLLQNAITDFGPEIGFGQTIIEEW